MSHNKYTLKILEQYLIYVHIFIINAVDLAVKKRKVRQTEWRTNGQAAQKESGKQQALNRKNEFNELYVLVTTTMTLRDIRI